MMSGSMEMAEDDGSSAGTGGVAKYSSTFGMYITLLGYSIGMSDVWRFPFLVYRNGGGAFLIPFVITLFLIGVPLYFLEFSIAKFSGKGPYKIWDICPLFRGTGAVICIGYMMYICGNSILRCWMFEFLRHAFQDPLPWSTCSNDWNSVTCRRVLGVDHPMTGNISTANFTIINQISYNAGLSNGRLNSSDEVAMTAAEEFWQYKILQLSSGISNLEPVQWRYMIVLFVFRLVVCLCVYKSIKWIEKVMYVTTLVPLALIAAIFIRSLTLPGWSDGVYHFFYPDFSKLLNTRIWIEASLMVFYTLAFGWGVIISMGSHATFRENGLRTALFVPTIGGMVAVCNGMVSFSVLGNMAHTYNVPVPDLLHADMSAGIVAYVTALVSFPIPQLWSVCFFTAVIIIGIDEQMIPVDMTIQMIGELFPGLYPRYRTHTLIGLSTLLLICTLPTCTGAGAYIFLWIDWYCAAWIGPCVALIEMFVVGWVYGLDRFSDDLRLMYGQPLPRILKYLLAFITPCIIAMLFITSCVDYMPPQYGSYRYPFIARILGWMSVAIVMLPLVIYAVHSTCRTSDNFRKRLRKQLQPNSAWGPCDDEAERAFQEKRTRYDFRSKTDMLVYNLCGRRAYDKNKHQELEKLNGIVPSADC